MQTEETAWVGITVDETGAEVGIVAYLVRNDLDHERFLALANCATASIEWRAYPIPPGKSDRLATYHAVDQARRDREKETTDAE